MRSHQGRSDPVCVSPAQAMCGCMHIDTWVHRLTHMLSHVKLILRHTHAQAHAHTHRHAKTYECTYMHWLTLMHTHSQICTVSRVFSHRRLYFPVLDFVKPQFKLEEELSSLKSVAGHRSECGHRRAQTGAACHALSPPSLRGCCPLSAQLLP